ncbi:hypothetical protein EYF80_017048 [Liparis tanakae]|uniref:Uncharacterized protein n=1 Tax=Liparis tanakae TaxID=230148 RepID=A0A4Z2I616_9TELE|nr:hypothetical protein EYF80_017048 [Liparis tanakae]
MRARPHAAESRREKMEPSRPPPYPASIHHPLFTRSQALHHDCLQDVPPSAIRLWLRTEKAAAGQTGGRAQRPNALIIYLSTPRQTKQLPPIL